jgi:hypothetical protein
MGRPTTLTHRRHPNTVAVLAALADLEDGDHFGIRPNQGGDGVVVDWDRLANGGYLPTPEAAVSIIAHGLSVLEGTGGHLPRHLVGPLRDAIGQVTQ